MRLTHLLSLFTIILAVSLWSCLSTSEKEADAHPGLALSKTYCVSCHQYAGPEMLDRKTWNDHMLPRMGYFMGIYPNDSVRQSLIETDPSAREAVLKANIFPEKPILDAEDWAAITAYYLQEAPEKLAEPNFAKVDSLLPLFKVKFPNIFLSPPSATLAQISPRGGLFLGDANSQSLQYFDQQLQPGIQAKVREGAVSLIEESDRLLLTVMGSFSPTDAASGFVLALPLGQNKRPVVLIDSLQRPVHNAMADFNGDGLQDLVISEFGKWTGKLAWWEQRPDGTYIPHLLRQRPGAIRTVIRDVNGDGLPDIYALFGQGDEGIWRYINQGNGRFKEEAVLHFPPTYGSSFFDLVDLDGDGKEEILYTCGDNADYPPFTKAYHGLRIFRQDNQGVYQEDKFVPLPGAYSVSARDFDQDGDIDLAVISFFPDFTLRPDLAFVYMENQGQGQYRMQTFPQVTTGRWIIMDAGDVDKDGDMDILLGSLAFEVVPPNPILEKWVRNGIPFIVLENQIIP